ncbi:1-acyl-sn-glycerol-3-phosphate acyltransferase alpha-like [Nothoprocta perdicaria]|uniref:1-acyl-sn-glycerol-3-phosphate acyltransferase alpha-like n=1 Tax=Nothoprocta perdicaria TaxID=30464 RepID=UPI000E1BDA37|nr:1-acyl-sn-glycerol-3-phosphate acyltransferase alpha-like [Nothoprocta perdicaria]
MDILPISYPFIFLLITFLVFYNVNPRFKYFCKMTFYKLWIFIISGLVVIVSIPRGRNPENMKYLQMLLLPLKYIFGIKIVVKGKENLRTNKPAILVLNHQNSLDITVMMEILPSRCVPIAKKEILYMGTFGLACWLSGIIFINRKKREESINILTEVAHSMNKENFQVLIFPEGTRNHAGSMLPFKRGAFQLAVKAQVPIIPVVISSYDSFYSQKERRFTTGKSTIQILPAVETQGLGPDDVPKLTEQVRDSMLAAYQGISGMTNGASH